MIESVFLVRAGCVGSGFGVRGGSGIRELTSIPCSESRDPDARSRCAMLLQLVAHFSSRIGILPGLHHAVNNAGSSHSSICDAT